ncbi:MAG TPA: 5'/3'-nucleotidase SurE [Candidatus Limnocylindria bacterium]|nr:5'/3'-nucleotidase SurE [Candidatus Limnocylindria bacterium]
MATRSSLSIGALLSLALVLAPAAGGAAPPLRVLVTDDDGVGAPGIDALVTALTANPQLEVTVVAPAVNQSGTGDRISNQPDATIITMAATTASGTPATAVDGFPADSVLWAVLTVLPERPDLVVSGINAGQNIGEAVGLSGTVGAARWAARLGIPAIAASVQFGESDYTQAAEFVADVVERFRTDKGFRKRMREKGSASHGIVLNFNFPDCPDGGRGMELVTVGRAITYTGHTLLDEVAGVRTWRLEQAVTNTNIVDCSSTAEDPTTDVEAFVNGFATLTPLTDEGQVSTRAMKQFAQIAKRY